MIDLLARLTPGDVRMDPFPHIVVTDVLEPDLFERLRESRPGFAQIGWAGEPPSARRIPCSAHQFQLSPHLPPIWRDFTNRMSAPAVLGRVVGLFAEHMPAHCPEVWKWISANPDAPTGLMYRDQFPAVRILTDARLEITTPVKGAAASHRRAHLDTPNRLFTGLFYFRDAADDLEGGDLGLYRWRAEPTQTGRFEIDDAEVELAVTVPYAANTLVLFPNSRHALHGVTLRAAGPYERAYLFFTAEVEQDLW